MKFRYGSYDHPDNEIRLTSLEVEPQISDRGKRWGTLYKLHCHGELIATGQAAIHAAIANLVNVYSQNYKDAGLYHDDGTPTKHMLPTNRVDNLSGNYVAYRSWGNEDPAEYATFRSYYIIIAALFADADSQVLHFRESVQLTGTGGPKWEYVRTQNQNATYQRLWTNDTQKVIQAGTVVGLQGWPLPWVQAPLFPTQEHQEQRVIHFMEPTWRGQQATHYGISWHYVHEMPAGVNALPNVLGNI